jgi:hypothetical protein
MVWIPRFLVPFPKGPRGFLSQRFCCYSQANPTWILVHVNK